MYLLDTNVISEAAPSKTQPSTDLVHWMERRSAELFLSVVTVAEIEDGVARLKRQGATRKAQMLSGWLESVLHLDAGQIVPVDAAVARVAGAMSDRAAGFAPGFADILIAATASHCGYTILTRNVKHFAAFGLVVIDPFQGLPPT